MSTGMIIGISIGLVIGVLLAASALFCFRYQRMRSQIGNSSSRRAAALPIRENADCSTIMSDSTLGSESPKVYAQVAMSSWLGGFRKSGVVSASGIPEYSYRLFFLVNRTVIFVRIQQDLS